MFLFSSVKRLLANFKAFLVVNAALALGKKVIDITIVFLGGKMFKYIFHVNGKHLL